MPLYPGGSLSTPSGAPRVPSLIFHQLIDVTPTRGAKHNSLVHPISRVNRCVCRATVFTLRHGVYRTSTSRLTAFSSVPSLPAYTALLHSSHVPRNWFAFANHRPSIALRPPTAQAWRIISLGMDIAPVLPVVVIVLGDALTLRAIHYSKSACWLFSASH